MSDISSALVEQRFGWWRRLMGDFGPFLRSMTEAGTAADGMVTATWTGCSGDPNLGLGRDLAGRLPGGAPLTTGQGKMEVTVDPATGTSGGTA